MIEDDTRWAIVHSRFRDPLDDLIALAPDEPFVQEMAAQRERIGRRYEEIQASIPEGLTRQERDEYVSAQVMGSIVADIRSDLGVPFAEPTDETEKP